MIEQAATVGETFPLWSNAPGPVREPSASQSDYALARRISEGNMDAFEELYQLYHRRVFSLCWRMTNNATEAEDLTQEIFIHVYRKIGSFRGESAMMTWLHRVAVNKVLMHFRKNAVRREKMTEDGESPEPKASGGGRVPDQIWSVDRLALESAVARLPTGYRTVLILHDVEGYEHQEIARLLGRSVGTSKSQLHKARMKLRELLGREFGPAAEGD